MSEEHGVELTPEAIDAFLGRGGTGVLSLARGDEPYATPVSYGYAPEARQFYLRLGFGPGSEKRVFVESTGGARLVAYRRDEEGWTSVVASGSLSAIDPDALSVEIANVLQDAEPPLVGVWEDDPDDVEFRLYRLAPDQLTGRTTARG